jgi:hypothetical protein
MRLDTPVAAPVAASSCCCFRRGTERVVGRRLGDRCGRSAGSCLANAARRLEKYRIPDREPDAKTNAPKRLPQRDVPVAVADALQILVGNAVHVQDGLRGLQRRDDAAPERHAARRSDFRRLLGDFEDAHGSFRVSPGEGWNLPFVVIRATPSSTTCST